MRTCLFCNRLKMENSTTSMFRMTDPKVKNRPMFAPMVPKSEPETDFSSEIARCSEESEEVEINNTPRFVDVKNRYIHDFNETTTSVNESSWPKEWFTAVESKFKLRRMEAAKNFGLSEKLRKLLVEAIEVGFKIKFVL